MAAPQSTAFSIPRAVYSGDERIYLMLLATHVVVSCSILCSKFTKNRSSTGLRPDPLYGLAYSAPQTLIYSWLKGAALRRRKGGKEGKGGRKRKEGGKKATAIPEQKSWLRPVKPYSIYSINCSIKYQYFNEIGLPTIYRYNATCVQDRETLTVT